MKQLVYVAKYCVDMTIYLVTIVLYISSAAILIIIITWLPDRN